MLGTPFEHAARLYCRSTRPDPTRTFKIPYLDMGCSRAASKPPFDYRTRLYSRYSRAAFSSSTRLSATALLWCRSGLILMSNTSYI